MMSLIVVHSPAVPIRKHEILIPMRGKPWIEDRLMIVQDWCPDIFAGFGLGDVDLAVAVFLRTHSHYVAASLAGIEEMLKEGALSGVGLPFCPELLDFMFLPRPMAGTLLKPPYPTTHRVPPSVG
jgi:hypothetical protein